MSAPNPSGSDRDGSGKEAAVAKTAGFVVFSGIAMSILKALNLNNKCPESQPQQESKFQKPITPEEKPIPKVPITHEKSLIPKTIEIVRGDTLWGLSRKYGVSIDAIKEANGLTGDTIYAGKKLVIP